MNCPSCQAIAPDNARFCEACGSPLGPVKVASRSLSVMVWVAIAIAILGGTAAYFLIMSRPSVPLGNAVSKPLPESSPSGAGQGFRIVTNSPGLSGLDAPETVIIPSKAPRDVSEQLREVIAYFEDAAFANRAPERIAVQWSDRTASLSYDDFLSYRKDEATLASLQFTAQIYLNESGAGGEAK